MLELPVTQGLADFEIRCECEGADYLFRYRWNGRAEAWFLDLSDADGTLIVAGRRLSVGSSLLESFAHLGVPPGKVVPFDTTLRDVDPAVDDLGVRVLVAYVESTEPLE